MRPLIWLRSDLRTDDNTALSHATQSATRGAIALFIISPGEWRAHDYAPARIDLMIRTLAELSRELEKLNIPLLIRTAPVPGDVPGLVEKICREHECDVVFFNREYEVNESRRDAQATELLRSKGRSVSAWDDQSVVAPGELRTGEGRYYTVFTPFKKTWIKHMMAMGGITSVPAPKRQPQIALAPDPVPTLVPGFETPESISSRWPAGGAHALKRLATFIAQRGNDYKAQRDFPATDGTSALSPYLAIGAISPRRCITAAATANTRGSKSPFDSGSEGLITWISEVIWREFYIHITVGFPRVCMHRAFQPATESIQWQDQPRHFEAWCQGRTGVPIVDAGMRQLLTTGWMHNRVRMVTAMYFSKNLFLNWRLGERFFMKHLIDGFLASNNGGWQWSASTGTDAAPYFRIFNPVSQSERFDPSGDYIRTYIPELRSLSSDAIHAPWTLPPLALTRLDYPAPLVDLSSSRQAAIEAFRVIKQG
jgi:deoxyribodipyrimidine photo-lyase